MWETGNGKIDSSGKRENRKSVIESDEVNHAERKDADVRNISNSLKKTRFQMLNSLESRSVPKNTRNNDWLEKDSESEGEELDR